MNSAVTGASRDLAACHLCYKLAPVTLHHCPRCGSAMHLRKSDSIQRTLALLITACLLYIPANIYPIMYTDQLGSTEASTILGGVILLIDLGSAPIAAVIFIFSVMVPSGKLMALFYLSTLYCAVRAVDSKRRGAWLAAGVACCALGMATIKVGDPAEALSALEEMLGFPLGED